MSDFTFYITKEPCPMCAGMLVNARVKRIVFGLNDPAYGGCGGADDISRLPGSLWHPEIVSGVLEEEAKKILQDFFRERRKK
jgi:tRNA(adenine34) deaminase